MFVDDMCVVENVIVGFDVVEGLEVMFVVVEFDLLSFMNLDIDYCG